MSAAAVHTLPGKIVPDRPPAPTAGAVLAQRAAKELELAALEAEVGKVAYLAATKGKSGAALLAEQHAKILAARFEIAANSAAHAYAVEADRAAVAAWRDEVNALPPE